MAKRVAVLAAVFLALSLADIISAFRFRYRGCPDGVEETRPDASDGDEPVVLTNDYILQFFVARTGLIDSNCTSLFLGQTVSPHLCNSNSIQFQFSQGSTLNNGNGCVQRICFDLAANGTLGSDVILYKRPTPNATFEDLQVFITETVRVEDFKLKQLISYRRIAREAMGWQVFHLGRRINDGIETRRFCISVLVRVQVNGTYTLLNRSSIQEVFILEQSNRIPFRALYIFRPLNTTDRPFTPSPDPFPFLKRSLPERDSYSFSECSVREHIVNLTQHNILAPKTANIGMCLGEALTDQAQQERGSIDLTSGEKQPSRICQPTLFDDLVVLHSNEHGKISIDTIPNAIVKDCGHTL